MPTEPVWNQVFTSLLAALRAIRRSGDSSYWYDVRRVSVIESAEPDPSDLPQLVVQPTPGFSSQVRVGDTTKVVRAETGFVITAFLRNDPTDKTQPFLEMGRMVRDIHRAIAAYDDWPKNVDKPAFPAWPNYDPAEFTGENPVIAFQYPIVVEFSYQWDSP